ncbi:DNA polymerase-3 subunit delta' [Haloferula luteola]|uniref:DNA polymerase-3 subunit delta n=1 Tax=Haloferula luteola TaxID=595692 RepID=A0A840V3W9_9BACT|nr:hypothetical protein [Haloferula luteola]MBB5352223.1 DNA polymerase-3 subunit delta' [Haloferula luteola]
MAFTEDRAYELIESAHRRQRLAHAFLISGSRESGKEALAARVIQLLQGQGGGGGIDLFGEAVPVEVPPLDEMAGEWVRIVRPQSKSRRITVDSIRELEKSLHVVSGEGTWKVGVVCDADRMMPAAENAFLKTLEEPPQQTLLLLLTENAGGLLPTVLSRCVRLPLMGGSRDHDEGGLMLLEALDGVAESGLGSPEVALGLKACFSEILGAVKVQAEAAVKELLKEEEKALKQAVEGDWLKRREEALKAVAEADYLSDRARLFDLLQSWMADVLRIKVAAGGLELPESRVATSAVAEREDLPLLMRRVDALRELRATLDTNAQEQLALEVGFLKAFA